LLWREGDRKSERGSVELREGPPLRREVLYKTISVSGLEDKKNHYVDFRRTSKELEHTVIVFIPLFLMREKNLKFLTLSHLA